MREMVAALDPEELVARLIVQIPDSNRHLIRSYGKCANAARAKGKRDATAAAEFSTRSGGAVATEAVMASVATEPDSAERKAASKRLANLIRHIYEVDPLVCPRCGGVMKIIPIPSRRSRPFRIAPDSTRVDVESGHRGSKT